MLFSSKKLSILVLLGLISFVACEDEMSLHVSIVESNFEQNDVDSSEEKSVDLCLNFKCESGENCVVKNNEASCECTEICEIPNDERQKICSSSNQTYVSDCHFLRAKCWCKHGSERCTEPAILNEKLDYYGECRYIGECSDNEKEMFPLRMKQWLNEVLLILSERKHLDPKYNNLVKLADKLREDKVEKYWTAGVTFEFCQLDKSSDHLIQKEELIPLITSIKALENCMQPFLNECDVNNDDLISDKEWGECLGLSNDDLLLLRKYC